MYPLDGIPSQMLTLNLARRAGNEALLCERRRRRGLSGTGTPEFLRQRKSVHVFFDQCDDIVA